MTIVVDISPQLEVQIRNCAAKNNSEELQKILSGIISSKVEQIMGTVEDKLSNEEFDEVLDQLANTAIAAGLNKSACLSNESVSRESIYSSHSSK